MKSIYIDYANEKTSMYDFWVQVTVLKNQSNFFTICIRAVPGKYIKITFLCSKHFLYMVLL